MGKKNSSGDAVSLVLVVITVVFTMLLAIAPVFLLVGWLYYRLKFRALSKNLSGDYSDFWLSPGQQEEFTETYSDLSRVTSQVDTARQQGASAGISVNKDGSFSARSKLGKELRQTIEALGPQVRLLTTKHYRLRDMPKDKWTSMVEAIKRVKSFEWAMLFWVNGFVISMYFMLKNIGFNINDLGLSGKSFDMISQTIQSSENGWLYLIGGLASAAFLGGVGFLGGGWRGAKNGSGLSPEPPEVTPENCFQY